MKYDYDSHMNTKFAETIRNLRIAKGLSQRELASIMYVTRSTIARWENGSRLPDAAMISRLARCLGVDINTLLSVAAQSDHVPNVILVDDNKIILSGAMPILEKVLPNATVIGFTRPSEAIEYAKAAPIALAFLDIEMGKTSGLDLCKVLLDINPLTNVIYLTAYVEYSYEAWNTDAVGFMLKPITEEGVLAQMKKLRHPFLLPEGTNV